MMDWAYIQLQSLRDVAAFAELGLHTDRTLRVPILRADLGRIEVWALSRKIPFTVSFSETEHDQNRKKEWDVRSGPTPVDPG